MNIETLAYSQEGILQKESKDFYHYLVRLHMKNKLNNMLVLPARTHFFYDEDDIKQVDGVINLSKLNYVKKLDDFLHRLYRMLKKDTVFCGCFVNNKRAKWDNNSLRKLLKSLVLIFETRMARLLSEKDVKNILNVNRFEIINMKEIRGVTYFVAKRT